MLLFSNANFLSEVFFSVSYFSFSERDSSNGNCFSCMLSCFPVAYNTLNIENLNVIQRKHISENKQTPAKIPQELTVLDYTSIQCLYHCSKAYFNTIIRLDNRHTQNKAWFNWFICVNHLCRSLCVRRPDASACTVCCEEKKRIWKLHMLFVWKWCCLRALCLWIDYRTV